LNLEIVDPEEWTTTTGSDLEIDKNKKFSKLLMNNNKQIRSANQKITYRNHMINPTCNQKSGSSNQDEPSYHKRTTLMINNPSHNQPKAKKKQTLVKSNQKQLEENLVYINYLKSDMSDLIDNLFEKQKLSTKCEILVVEFLLQLEEFKRIYKLYNRGITLSRVKHMLDSMKIIKSFSVSKLPIYFEQLEETLNKLY